MIILFSHVVLHLRFKWMVFDLYVIFGKPHKHRLPRTWILLVIGPLVSSGITSLSELVSQEVVVCLTMKDLAFHT